MEPVGVVDGAYFIDADPDRFGVILNYLRDKTVDIPPYLTRKGIIQAAIYFGLDLVTAELQDQEEEEKEEKVKRQTFERNDLKWHLYENLPYPSLVLPPTPPRPRPPTTPLQFPYLLSNYCISQEQESYEGIWPLNV